MTFYLGSQSQARLEGVHPDLVKVVKRAITATTIDFAVLEGMRTEDSQRKLFQAGATQTMNSRHLTGHAVDLAVWMDGIRWDWPMYYQLANSIKMAAMEEGITIEWGGDWTTFKDGPHWQLPWKTYPE